MPSTATLRNRLEKQAAGENSNTWGGRLNTNVIDLVDEAMDGVTAIVTAGGTTILSANDYATDQSRKRVLNCTGTGGTITIPNLEKVYLIRNASSGIITDADSDGFRDDPAGRPGVGVLRRRGERICGNTAPAGRAGQEVGQPALGQLHHASSRLVGR